MKPLKQAQEVQHIHHGKAGTQKGRQCDPEFAFCYTSI